MQNTIRAAHRVALAMAVALLAACATTPSEPGLDDATVAAAKRAEASGRYAEAAERWERAADQSQRSLRDRYLLRAAEARAAGGDYGAAEALLERVDQKRLPAGDLSRYGLLRAEEALLDGDAAAASLYLDLARRRLPDNQFERYLAIEESIQRMRTAPASEVLARLERELGRIEPVTAERVADLMRRMESVAAGDLRRAAGHAGAGSPAASWAALIVRIREALVAGEGLSSHASDWAESYPDHPISGEDFIALANAYGSRFTTPPVVGVLLPNRGGLAAAGAAIRDGMLSAYLAQPGGSILRLYDSGDSPDTALEAYQKALDDGVDWIIGPLDRQSVEAVSARGAATVPMLLLNRSERAGEDPSSAPRFSLSLSQEDEARAVARRMLAANVGSVITLSSETLWGARMEQAFLDAFTAGGGRVADIARFSTRESDHSDLLRRLLHIERSEQRKDRLQSILGQNLVFEPSVRNDFAAFFLSAEPEQARQLKPQLRFFEAGDKPVFAMGRAFSGVVNPDRDQDLNGIRLPLTPAQLEVSQGAALPQVGSVREGSLLNLYALGMDAWRLIAWMPLLQANPELTFSGRVGALSASPEGHMRREPAWAVFSKGRPRPLSWPAASD